VDQQIRRVDVFRSQVAMAEPMAFTSPVNKAAKGLPLALVIEPETRIGLLPENIVPFPLIQLFQDIQSTKFAISNQKNGCISW
jgi:hypothetical protein